MKSRPILFSGDMVRAILEGRKTQTRRPFKAPKFVSDSEIPEFIDALNRYGGSYARRGSCDGLRRYVGPFGVPGDELWVRETFWSENESCDHEYCVGCDMGPLSAVGPCQIDYCATPECHQPPTPAQHQTVRRHDEPVVPGYWWLAPPVRMDESAETRESHGEWVFIPWRWATKIPSIHMPRWASRLALEVTDVRVQRVQHITEEGAVFEGFEPVPAHGEWVTKARHEGGHWSARKPFADKWSAAYPAQPWDANPWVWAISFEVRP